MPLREGHEHLGAHHRPPASEEPATTPPTTARHLDAEFNREPVTHVLTERMDAYGFSISALVDSLLAATAGGYTTDAVIGGTAQSWLRDTGGADGRRAQTMGVVRQPDQPA